MAEVMEVMEDMAGFMVDMDMAMARDLLMLNQKLMPPMVMEDTAEVMEDMEDTAEAMVDMAVMDMDMARDLLMLSPLMDMVAMVDTVEDMGMEVMVMAMVMDIMVNFMVSEIPRVLS